MKVLRFDGASRGNPGHGSCAAVVIENNQVIQHTFRRLPGIVTNNQAEYMGLIAGLRMAAAYGFKEIQIEGDSKLVIEQLFGSWECKHPRIKSHYKTAKELLKFFDFVNGRWIPREQNKEADAYCNLALDKGQMNGLVSWFDTPIAKKDKVDLRNFFQVVLT